MSKSIILFLDGTRGQYIPRDFAQTIKREKETGKMQKYLEKKEREEQKKARKQRQQAREQKRNWSK